MIEECSLYEIYEHLYNNFGPDCNPYAFATLIRCGDDFGPITELTDIRNIHSVLDHTTTYLTWLWTLSVEPDGAAHFFYYRHRATAENWGENCRWGNFDNAEDTTFFVNTFIEAEIVDRWGNFDNDEDTTFFVNTLIEDEIVDMQKKQEESTIPLPDTANI